MAVVAQLRMIDPAERFTTCELDLTRGMVTIGSRPTDDILLDSPDLFYLQLDYRRPPYRLTIPADSRAITINDEFVPPGDSYDVRDRDVMRVAGYTITFRAYDDEQAPGDVVQPPPAESEPDLPQLPEDHPSEPLPQEDNDAEEKAGPSILVSLPEEEQAWIIDVDHTVTLHLSVVNAGPLVAQFNLAVEGVPRGWVDVDPPEVHLNESAVRTVTVTVTPPRLPTSRAGTHRVTIVVTSPDHYPDERAQAGADITIKPYYALDISNISPQTQSIPWSEPSAQVEVPLANKGNSEIVVGLAGEDDALACHFEFQIPSDMDEPLSLSRQVNLCLPFDQAVRVPVKLIPRNRPLIGAVGRLFDLRPRIYPYTITVTTPQSPQGPWTLMGTWQNSPRLSRRVLSLSILAALLLLLAGTGWVFSPKINTSDYVRPASIRAGQLVELDWEAWPPFLIGFKLDGQAVTPPLVDRPEQTTTYELRADTWLSRLLPALSAIELDKVVVRPVTPHILLFQAQPPRAAPGQAVVLSWVVDDARELVLVDHGAGFQETLTTPCGSREIQVGEEPAHYTLRVIGADGAVVERALTVDVGSPIIKVFSVAPTSITAPAVVTLTWEVLGARDAITLSGRSLSGSEAEWRDTPIPISVEGTRGSVAQPVTGTTLFSLAAGRGADQVVDTVRVRTLKPTPVPATDRASTNAPSPVLVDARSDEPDTIIVYTALSPAELETFELGVMPDRPLTAIPDTLRASGLTLEELENLDYIYTPPNDLGANILIVRRSTEDLIRQLLAEKDNPRADVIWVVAATGMIRLRAEGLLEPLAGLYEPPGLDNIKPTWRDPTLPPHWLGLSAWLTTFCVNKERLPHDDDGTPLIPHSWTDLTNPRYRDQIAMPGPGTSGTGYMAVSSLIQMQPFGEPDGWAHLDRLHENIAHYTARGDEPCQMAADGRVAVGIGSNLCSSADPFPNLLLVYPREGAGWEMDAVALVRKDTINYRALDFVAWAISRPAMEQYARFRSLLAYEGFKPSPTCVEGLDEVEIIPDRLTWASANLERITEKWESRYSSAPD